MNFEGQLILQTSRTLPEDDHALDWELASLPNDVQLEAIGLKNQTSSTLEFDFTHFFASSDPLCIKTLLPRQRVWMIFTKPFKWKGPNPPKVRVRVVNAKGSVGTQDELDVSCYHASFMIQSRPC